MYYLKKISINYFNKEEQNINNISLRLELLKLNNKKKYYYEIFDKDDNIYVIYNVNVDDLLNYLNNNFSLENITEIFINEIIN